MAVAGGNYELKHLGVREALLLSTIVSITCEAAVVCIRAAPTRACDA